MKAESLYMLWVERWIPNEIRPFYIRPSTIRNRRRAERRGTLSSTDPASGGHMEFDVPYLLRNRPR